jgi:hypothetical protein
MVSPGFVTSDDLGQKGLLLSIKTLQQLRTDGFPLKSVLGCETSRTHLAHTFEYPKTSITTIALPLLTESGTANCRLVMRRSA